MSVSTLLQLERDEPGLEQLQGYKINAFISAVVRARWFLLATIVVSTMILAQTYVAWNGCESKRLAVAMLGEQPDAINNSLDRDLRSLLQLPAATKAQRADAQVRALIEAARRITERHRTINMLNSVKTESRALWMLPFNAPEGDFLPLMSLMLTILSACLWLSARAVVHAVRQCQEPTFRAVARLNLLFPISWGAPAMRKQAADSLPPRPMFRELSWRDLPVKLVEMGALFTPFVALVLATGWERSVARPLINAGDHGTRVHFGILFVMIVVLAALAVVNVFNTRALDHELYCDCSRQD